MNAHHLHSLLAARSLGETLQELCQLGRLDDL